MDNCIKNLKMSKRFTSLLISGTLSFTLVGCGINEKPNFEEKNNIQIEQTIENDFLSDNTYVNSLTKDKQKEYYELNNLYRSLLDQYIAPLGVKKYDDMVLNSNFNLMKTMPEAQDYYQHFTNEFQYYYVRNNLYIERLNEEDLNYLKNKLSTNDLSLDDQSKEFIARTFPIVIKAYPEKNDNLGVFYGPSSSLNYSAPNDALVIGFRYDEFNSNGQNDKEWHDNYMKQKKLIFNLNQKLEKELASQLNKSVKVIEYNNYTVQPIKKRKS